MVAYLLDDTDYYQGRVALHTIKSIIALEGGHPYHLDVFLLALHRPFTYRRYDLQCPLSLLFLLPYSIRLGMAAILWEESTLLAEEYGVTEVDEIYTPLYVMLLHARVTGCPLPNLGVEVCSHRDRLLKEISFLTGTSIPPKGASSVIERMENYLGDTLPGSPFTEPLITVGDSGSRQYTFAYIAKGLGYSDESTTRLFNAAALYQEELGYV